MPETILVTGVSGFIAKHVAQNLLGKGYHVRGTLRALNKAEQVRRSLGESGVDISGLSFAAADLISDKGWDDAAEGCAGVMHVASPFPIAAPRDRYALVPAAREGTLRVLRAARKTDRIILTSSLAAMMYRPNRPHSFAVTENDWTDTDWKLATAYIISKTEAERAAWKEAETGGYRHRLTSVNPGLVLGPAIDDDIGASLDLVRLFMRGAYPAIPPIAIPTVDVRDVAELHVRALENPETGGRRLICAGETLPFSEIANILREAFPDYAARIPARELPAWLVRAAALFDRSLASVLADLGASPQPDTAYLKDLTGFSFRPAKEAVIAAAQSLLRIKAL